MQSHSGVIVRAPHSTFFFLNDTATTEIYTLSLHDALPIFLPGSRREPADEPDRALRHELDDLLRSLLDRPLATRRLGVPVDRKSTRLNSSHANISYAVFCLKKKINRMTLLLQCFRSLDNMS